MSTNKYHGSRKKSISRGIVAMFRLSVFQQHVSCDSRESRLCEVYEVVSHGARYSCKYRYHVAFPFPSRWLRAMPVTHLAPTVTHCARNYTLRRLSV